MLNWMSNYLLLNATDYLVHAVLMLSKTYNKETCSDQWLQMNVCKHLKYPSRYLQEPRALSISIWCKGGLDWPGRKGSPAPARYKKYWFTLQSLKKIAIIQLSGLQTESSPLVLSLMKVKHIRSPGIGSLKYCHGHSLIDRIH